MKYCLNFYVCFSIGDCFSFYAWSNISEFSSFRARRPSYFMEFSNVDRRIMKLGNCETCLGRHFLSSFLGHFSCFRHIASLAGIYAKTPKKLLNTAFFANNTKQPSLFAYSMKLFHVWAFQILWSGVRQSFGRNRAQIQNVDAWICLLQNLSHFPEDISWLISSGKWTSSILFHQLLPFLSQV